MVVRFTSGKETSGSAVGAQATVEQMLARTGSQEVLLPTRCDSQSRKGKSSEELSEEHFGRDLKAWEWINM
jgi:hypothetical protein